MKRCPITDLAYVILMLAALVSGCSFYQESDIGSAPHASQNNNAALSLFGNISEATDHPTNFLVTGEGSALSYNNSRGTVNWVAWETTRNDLGEPVERPDFRPDPRLPATFSRIVSTDYSGSGYDRGHLVPAADRYGSPKAFVETFLMTNISPQTGSLNQYPWQQFESYVRAQVRRGWDAYQIAGVHGEQGLMKNRVVVPTNCWKVVVFLRASVQPREIDRRTRIVAVDMPNIDGLENVSWQRYRTNIRSIEVKTGYNFFAALPADLQETIETRTELSFR